MIVSFLINAIDIWKSFLLKSPADHQGIVPGRCRALMNGPVLSINRSARPVGPHAKQQLALKYTVHTVQHVHKI